MQSDNFTAKNIESAPSMKGSSQLLAQIQAESSCITEIQDGYHPVFGLTDVFGKASRRELLETTITEILKRTAEYEHRHLRVFEAGCNLGYVSMSLALSIPTVIGIEYNQGVAEFAKLVAAYNGSSAVFEHGDAFAMMTDEGTVGQIDCFLALNVLHQIIFQRGLEETQKVVRKITESVDLAFFELASQSDYVSFGKGHLLPADPLEVFAKCFAISIEIIRTTPRLFVLVRRTILRIEDGLYPIITWRFGENNDPNLVRKFYQCSGAFIKEFRYSEKQPLAKLRQEAGMLQAANNLGVGPKFIKAVYGAGSGLLIQERLYGPVLSEALAIVRQLNQEHGILKHYFKTSYSLARGELYHNDLSAHNFIYHGTEAPTLIDFEQTSPDMIIDHHFLLSWFIFDLLAGRAISYERDVYSAVRGRENNVVINPLLFAPFNVSLMPQKLAELISDNAASTDWRRLIVKWVREIEMDGIIPQGWNALDAGAIQLTAEELEPAITVSDVTRAFIDILRRPPENDTVIKLHLRLRTMSALERQLRASHEYQSR